MSSAVIITIPNESPISWNKFYSGKHWAVRKQEADRVHQLVRGCIDPDAIPFAGLVNIIITAYFPNKRLLQDPDNICCKLYIDGLKWWVIADDDTKHVRSVLAISELDREKPRIEIVVSEAEP